MTHELFEVVEDGNVYCIICVFIFQVFHMEAVKMRNNGDGKTRDKLFITEEFRMKN